MLTKRYISHSTFSKVRIFSRKAKTLGRHNDRRLLDRGVVLLRVLVVHHQSDNPSRSDREKEAAWCQTDEECVNLDNYLDADNALPHGKRRLHITDPQPGVLELLRERLNRVVPRNLVRAKKGGA